MQMIPEKRYGEVGLSRMRSGESPDEILRDVVLSDAGRDVRQVAMLDTRGRVTAFTGKGCVAESGNMTGDGCSVQGAMVESSDVWTSMMETFTAAPGALADRMLSALRAGEENGGDIRGPRAAALVVVAAKETDSWPASRPLNIRVDDHPDPLSEIERHLELQRNMSAIELAFERGLGGDASGAIDDYARLATKTSDDPDVTMRYGIMLAMSGDIDGAREQLLKMSRVHEGWAKLPARLIAAGLLPDDPRLRLGHPFGGKSSSSP